MYKHFYRRYRVCPACCRADSVDFQGTAKRYCQQCACFQAVEQFNGKRRSCIKALERHRNPHRTDGMDIADNSAEAGHGSARPGASKPGSQPGVAAADAAGGQPCTQLAKDGDAAAGGRLAAVDSSGSGSAVVQLSRPKEGLAAWGVTGGARCGPEEREGSAGLAWCTAAGCADSSNGSSTDSSMEPCQPNQKADVQLAPAQWQGGNSCPQASACRELPDTLRGVPGAAAGASMDVDMESCGAGQLQREQPPATCSRFARMSAAAAQRSLASSSSTGCVLAAQPTGQPPSAALSRASSNLALVLPAAPVPAHTLPQSVPQPCQPQPSLPPAGLQPLLRQPCDEPAAMRFVPISAIGSQANLEAAAGRSWMASALAPLHHPFAFSTSPVAFEEWLLNVFPGW